MSRKYEEYQRLRTKVAADIYRRDKSPEEMMETLTRFVRVAVLVKKDTTAQTELGWFT